MMSSLNYSAESNPEDLPISSILQVRSVISTPSSYTQRMQQTPRQFNQIGQGLQGVVFEKFGEASAIKKERPGNDRLPSNLRREYRVHQAVYDTFKQFGPIVDNDVHVPRPHSFVPKPEIQQCWDLASFPEEYQTPGDIVSMERILPMPKVVRKALIARFYPHAEEEELASETIEKVLSDPPNKHALIRTYFGRNDTTFTAANFSLRNFPLCLRHMESLGLDMKRLARSMGQAYAIMHWGAGVDGDDVEFVLGTLLLPVAGGEISPTNLQKREMRYFLLDFGQCQSVDLSKEDYSVYQAFKGAMVLGDNQSFIPHYSKSPALFEAFKEAYMEAGQKILVEKGLEEKFSIEEFMKEYLEYAEDFL